MLERVSLDDALTDKPSNNNCYQRSTNQLIQTSTHHYTYDLRGNRHTKTHTASDNTQTYYWNGKNQLLKVTGYDFDEQQQKPVKVDLEYRYDALGRRTQKRDGNTTHHYLYDRFDLIAIHTFYPDGTESTATLIHDETMDTPLSIKNRHSTFYYHRDHQGSILALTDEQGNTVESFEYNNSYGVIIKHTTTERMDTQNPFGYTGREMDRQDLYYDPTTQTFLSLV